MKVLLATDGAPQSVVAINTAAQLLRKEDVKYDLLCVAPEFIPPKAKEEKNVKKRARMIETYREKIRAESYVRLTHLQASLATRGIEAEMRIAVGSPARVISEFAGDYSLTVVGAHDTYTRGKEGLGPVASRVVASTSNAVLVGRELSSDRNWRILIAVDGSLAADHALQLMAAYFRVQSAEITLMHVTETPWVHLGLGREWFGYPKEMIDRSGNQAGVTFENELSYEAEDVVETSRTLLESHGLAANTVITEGDPALEIASEAERGDYDLIVLGATGASDLKHEMLGSVSTRVAQNAPCSVLIVRFTE